VSGGGPWRPRGIRALVRDEWRGAGRGGLLAADPRVRILRRVLGTYPEVCHIVPDRISLEASTGDRVLDTVVQFLRRQQWLVTSVVVE